MNTVETTLNMLASNTGNKDLKKIGVIIFRDGYIVQLFQNKEGDYIRRETLPTEVDKEEPHIISWSHSRFDIIPRQSVYSYCVEYFGFEPQDCRNQLRVL